MQCIFVLVMYTRLSRLEKQKLSFLNIFRFPDTVTRLHLIYPESFAFGASLEIPAQPAMHIASAG